MKKLFLCATFAILGLMTITSAFASMSNPETTYSPGVRVGDSVTFGKISAIWRSNSTPPPFIQQFNQTKSLQETVTNVNGKIVTALLTFNYANGTHQTNTATIDVQTGYGNLSFFIIAGGLGAGDQVYQTPYPSSLPTIGETVTKLYAGALRPVNSFNATNVLARQLQVLFDWDVRTGFLLEVLENSSAPYANLSLHFKVTGTNVWQPSSSSDFGFDAIPESSQFLHLGESVTFTLILNSTNMFRGFISLKPAFLNSTQPKASLSLSRTTVSLSPGLSNSSALRFSTNASTSLGLYLFSVNGTSDNISHTVTIAVTVSPPDFDMTARPANLTLSPGTSKSSVITLKALGSFTGRIFLSATSYDPLTLTIQPSNVTLSPTTTTANSTLTVHVPPGGPPRPYSSVFVMGTSGLLSHQIYIPVNVTAPDFRIFTNPSFLNLRAGASARSTVTLTSILGFSGTVNLSTFAYGVYGSVDKNSVFVNSTTTPTATLTVTAPVYIGPGAYNVFVDGASGNLTHSASVIANVTAPGFHMTIDPSSFVLKEGSNATATITLRSFLGFSGTVSLFPSVFPTNGPTVSIDPPNVFLAPNGTSTSRLTVSTLSSIPGFYYIQITGSSGSLTQYATVTVNVIGPDFGISASPSFLTLPQGSSAASSVTLNSVNNFNGTIVLSSFVNGPPGITTSINPANVTLSSNVTTANVTVTIRVDKFTTPGFYTVQVTGTSGRLLHQTFITVDVTAAPEFEITATSPVDFNSGSNGISTITITPLNGFMGSVALTSTTSPSGLTVKCPTSLVLTSPAPVTGTCTLSSTTPGSYLVTVTAISGALSHNATFVSDVGDFLVSAKTPVDFNSGATEQVIVTVAGMNNFAGNITLTASSPGLTVTCPTTPVSVTSNRNIQATCSVGGTVSGRYELTITGTSSPGSVSRYAKAIVYVGDFTISASSGSFNSGASGASIAISLTSRFNFAGSVNLSTGTFPSMGLNVSCPTGPIPVTPNATSTASCILSSTSPGTYQIRVSGSGTPGTVSISTTSTIHVGDFTISATAEDMNSGVDGSVSVSLTSINNFAGSISLTGTTSNGLEVSCTGAPTSITANSTISASCTLISTTPGTYSVTITAIASSSILSHSASAVIHVGDFTISIRTPSNIIVGSPNALVSVGLTSKFNFAGTVVLNPDNTPAKGLTITCPAVTLKANGSSSANCTIGADSVGTYLVMIMGRSLPGTGSQSSAGIVQVVDFTVAAGVVSPSTIPVGSSGTSSITVSTVNGFTGTVTLAVSSPSGLACSFDHTTVQSGGTSTLSCIGNSPGDYSITVAAIGGATFRQTSLTFHVVSAPPAPASSPTMFGLQLAQFYGLVGGTIVAIAVAAVTVVVRRKR